MTPAIRVEDLGKRYRIGHAAQRGSYRTLRESLMDGVSTAVRRFRGGSAEVRTEEFWALKGVDFEVQPGEVVGVIGRNGAGKSTLLKILSRITEPTEGRVRLRGRVGSLLEVGTGFHPELSGRENIYLNGAILGMSRREIARNFDEIVAFAEVEKFLDTPVKRYSSGMYVRLAFAVAAFLQPEILIVDEVLAVGDATYQKRCIDRMAALATSGSTILFVSHNMDLIPRLCERAILLDKGRFIEDGPAKTVVDDYLMRMIDGGSAGDLEAKSRSGDGRARFETVEIIGPEGRPREVHRSGDDLRLRITIRPHARMDDVGVAVILKTPLGARIITGWTREVNFPVNLASGRQTLECRFEAVRLRPGRKMMIELWMEAGSVMDHVDDALVFDVVDGDDTDRYSSDIHQGAVLNEYDWSNLEHPDD